MILMTLLVQSAAMGQGKWVSTDGATVKVKGSPTMVLSNVSVDFAGNYLRATETISMRGDETSVNHQLASTSRVLLIHNLEIDKSANDAQLASNLSVNGQVLLTRGGINLNGFSLALEGASILGETEENGLYGDGEIRTVVTLTAPEAANPGNLGFEITSSEFLGPTTVIRRQGLETNGSDTSILRQFFVDPLHNESLSATVRFSYRSKELNGLDESKLTSWQRFDGGTWQILAANAIDTSENVVEIVNLDSLSYFTVSSHQLTCEVSGHTAEVLVDSTNNTIAARLSWNPVDIGNEYRVVIKSGGNFSFTEIVADTTYTIPNLLPNTTYDWKVVVRCQGSWAWPDYQASFRTPDGPKLSRWVELYPNPTQEVFKIWAYGLGEENLSFKLHSASGKSSRLKVEKITGDLYEIVSPLPNGVYFLTIQGNQFTTTKKLIIQRE